MQGEVRSEIAEYTIYNTLRYGDQNKFPNNLTVLGTLEQATELAEWMSSWWPGQEGMWLVKGHEDD